MTKLTEDQRTARALQCRKVRLWIASNPGRTIKEIAAGTGVGRVTESRLNKMLEMGIVRKTQEQEESGFCPTRWFVVPQ